MTLTPPTLTPKKRKPGAQTGNANARGQPLTWQNFTALLLLQRAFHDLRSLRHAGWY